MTRAQVLAEAMMTEDYSKYILDGSLPDDETIEMPRLERVASVDIPRLVDLRADCSPVENQGEVGSCVANAVVGAMEYLQIRKRHESRDLSRLFVYYNARRLGERIGQSGTRNRLAMAAVLGWGVCPASMWPYQTAMVDERPTRDCYEIATGLTGVQFAQTSYGVGAREALASGLPVVFGMQLPELAFRQTARTGELRPPEDGNWEQPSGGHAMLLVGYDDDRNAWLVRNSWGEEWGDGGHFWLDYEVMPYYTKDRTSGVFVVGDIENSRAFRLAGPSLNSMFETVMASAPQSVRAAMPQLRSEIAADLDDSLSNARKSIRDRLRGPGAGGGY